MLHAALGIVNRSPVLRRTMNRVFYQYLAGLDTDGDVTLMNYGYIDQSPDAAEILMSAEDEENRLCLQLYHRVAGALDLQDCDVLEVGSGRGGGAAYVKRTFSARSMTGVDYSERAVAFCQQAHRESGVTYLHGDAESLPFEASQFDAVINVESSHCYGIMARFLAEVHRVLRPGGQFSWTDFRALDEIAKLDEDIRSAGFEIVQDTRITPNVLAAMHQQEERYRALIDRKVPPMMRWLFVNFAGVEGSSMLRRLQSGELVYLHKVMRKVA